MIQEVPEELKYINHDEIINCYEHFKLRIIERNYDTGGNLNYKRYWDEWILNMKGVFVYELKSKKQRRYRMIRLKGNYHKDEILTVFVYQKTLKHGIYIPLTLYYIEDHKSKFSLYMQTLNNKKFNIIR